MRYYKRLPLEGMSNCRDLGGYPTVYGGVTRFGGFVRSEAPVNLSGGDIEFIKNYGVTKSLDFRGEGDVTAFPSSLNVDGIEYIRMPMFERADALGFGTDKDPSEGFNGWGKSYIQWIEVFKGWVRDVFTQLASADGACQFNCNAGKDRTGIISALALAVAGVDVNDIAFDYCVSRAMLKPRFAQLSGQWGDYLKDERGQLIVNHPFLFTPRDAMFQLFKYINVKYVNAENYLYSCGVSEKNVYEIKSKLL